MLGVLVLVLALVVVGCGGYRSVAAAVCMRAVVYVGWWAVG